MNIEEGIFLFLKDAVELKHLIGDSIFPLTVPEREALPYITYRRISGARVRSISGPSGIARPRFQFDIYALKYDDSRDIANALRRAMDGFSGFMGSVQVGSVTLYVERDQYQDESRTYRFTLDFVISHKEA